MKLFQRFRKANPVTEPEVKEEPRIINHIPAPIPVESIEKVAKKEKIPFNREKIIEEVQKMIVVTTSSKIAAEKIVDYVVSKVLESQGEGAKIPFKDKI